MVTFNFSILAFLSTTDLSENVGIFYLFQQSNLQSDLRRRLVDFSIKTLIDKSHFNPTTQVLIREKHHLVMA